MDHPNKVKFVQCAHRNPWFIIYVYLRRLPFTDSSVTVEERALLLQEPLPYTARCDGQVRIAHTPIWREYNMHSVMLKYHINRFNRFLQHLSNIVCIVYICIQISSSTRFYNSYFRILSFHVLFLQSWKVGN